MTRQFVSALFLSSSIFEHEPRHGYQYGAPAVARFVPAYFTADAIQGQCNVFEASAGSRRGSYSC